MKSFSCFIRIKHYMIQKTNIPKIFKRSLRNGLNIFFSIKNELNHWKVFNFATYKQNVNRISKAYIFNI